MSDLTPTRSAALQLTEERRTMREGYAFLDEKCLLLAGEMLRAVRQQQALERELAPLQAAAQAALRAAVARHGLHGLEVMAAAPSAQQVETRSQALLGVPLLAAALSGTAPVAPPPVNPSPEAAACRRAWAALLPKLAELAAVSGNLARLYAEYRRTVRRVRALQDVLLPEVEQQLGAIETALEELEQDEAGFLRRAAAQAAGR
jgi:V/A-type H+-transporting ATPase subunit D